MRLYIQTDEDTHQLTGAVDFKFDGFKSAIVDTTVDLVPDYSTLFNNSFDSGSIEPPVVSINGVQPTDTGAFFIDGSVCTSWDSLLNIDDQVTYLRNEKHKSDEQIVDMDRHELFVVDLCPSCTTCENLYRLKYETENLWMWLNTLKNVNLMAAQDGVEETDPVYRDNRRLAEFRVTGATAYDVGSWDDVTTSYIETNWEACGPTDLPDDSFMRLRGLALLKQYITTVHMWNYVVSQNNSSTEIQIAPESEAGFVIQTKRALPSCGGEQQIRCTIDVDVLSSATRDLTPLNPFSDGSVEVFPTHTGLQTIMADNGATPSGMTLLAPYILNTYIPKANLEFKPFRNSVPEQCIPDSTNQMDAIPSGHMVTQFYPDVVVSIAGTTIAYPRNTHKTFSTKIMGSTVAGTYVASVKVLPFINRRLFNARGEELVIRGRETSVAGMDVKPVHENPQDPTSPIVNIDYAFISGQTEYIARDADDFPNPTEEDYLRSTTAPTRSVPFELVWNIVVKWDVLTPGATNTTQTYTQTYNYQCNAVRVYYGVGMSSIQLRPLLPVSGGTVTAGGE